MAFPSPVTTFGDATSVVCDNAGGPAMNTTLVFSETDPVDTVIVLACATVDVMFDVTVPLAPVVPTVGVNVFELPELVNVTGWFGTGLLNASRTVMVTVV